MLNLFIRCIVIYFFLLLAMRLMGKRQLGELQPFEFAITLVASELVCIPMADATIPIIYGIIPVFTLFLMHIIITKVASKSVRFRKFLNGKPVIVIEKGNILPNVMQELNMNIDDIMEALRGSGYFNPSEVEYAILETNGSMTVLPKAENKPLCPQDIGLTVEAAEIPVTIIMEGDFLGNNLSKIQGITKERIMKMLSRFGLKQEDILILLISGTNVYMQPYSGGSFTAELSGETAPNPTVEIVDSQAESVEIYPTLNAQEAKGDAFAVQNIEGTHIRISFDGDGRPVISDAIPKASDDASQIDGEMAQQTDEPSASNNNDDINGGGDNV